MHKSRHGRRGGSKARLADAVYRRHGGLTRGEAADVVETIIGTMKTSLLDGRPVKIQNFGVFEIVPRRARRGIDPSSGRSIEIPAHKGLAFRPASRLRRAIGPPRSSEG